MRVPLRRVLILTFAVLLIAVGALWTFQGLGYIKGSEMTDVQIWAVIGPIVAGLGVGLGTLAFRRDT